MSLPREQRRRNLPSTSMAFLPGAPPLLMILISTLALVSLSIIDCGSSKLSLLQIGQPSLPLYNTNRLPPADEEAAGSLYGRGLRSRLRGGAQEEEEDLLEALHYLEREVQESPRLGREFLDSPQFGKEMLVDKIELKGRQEEEEEEEEEEERHPADILLQRHQADATISYILGGY